MKYYLIKRKPKCKLNNRWTIRALAITNDDNKTVVILNLFKKPWALGVYNKNITPEGARVSEEDRVNWERDYIWKPITKRTYEKERKRIEFIYTKNKFLENL